MPRYYTRACNFYYGKKSKTLVSKKKSIPLNGNKELSFDSIEIISRKSKKKIHIKNTLHEVKLNNTAIHTIVSKTNKEATSTV